MFSVWCGAATAQAQALEVQPMQPGAGMVFTRVSAGQHAFAVYFGRGRHPIAACTGDCGFWAWPGKYAVVVDQGDGPHEDARVALHIDGNTSYRFVPANGQTQNAGIVLGVAGPTLGVAGLLWFLALDLRSCHEPECSTPTATYVSLSMLGLGVAMTAVGWPLYQYNRAHFAAGSAAAVPQPQVGVMPMPHGGLGLGAKFDF